MMPSPFLRFLSFWSMFVRFLAASSLTSCLCSSVLCSKDQNVMHMCGSVPAAAALTTHTTDQHHTFSQSKCMHMRYDSHWQRPCRILQRTAGNRILHRPVVPWVQRTHIGPHIRPRVGKRTSTTLSQVHPLSRISFLPCASLCCSIRTFCCQGP